MKKQKFNYIFLGLPLISGIILGLLFYKIIPSYVIFIAFFPLLFFIDRVRNWRFIMVGGFLMGLSYFLMFLFSSIFIEWFGFITAEAPFLKVSYAVASIAGGGFYSLFTLATYFSWKRHWSMMFLIPAFFVLMEFSKRWVAFGFTWGFIGYLTEELSWLRQEAALFGVLGLAFVIVFINVGIFLAFKHFKDRNTKKGIITTVVLLGTVLSSFLLTIIVQKELHEKDLIRVTIMQSNYTETIQSFTEEPYYSLLKEAQQQNPDLIVMPESLFNTQRPEKRQETEESLSDVMGDFSGLIAFGGYRSEQSNLYNSFFLWKEGVVFDVYDKHYLAPFAEYSPPLLSKFAPKSITLYNRGDRVQTLEDDSLKLGVLICQEIIYPEAGLRPTNQGSDILIGGANDGVVRESLFLKKWIPSESHWFHKIEHTMARFRAIENGRYFARSTKIGIASIIDPLGKELVAIESGRKDIATRDIYRIEGLTPYTRFGDAPLFTLSFITIITIGFKRIIKRKKHEV